MTFVAFALVGRYLGPERFGVYSLAYGLPLLFSALVDFGFSAVATREIVQRAEPLWATSGLRASWRTLPVVWVALIVGSWVAGLRGQDFSLIAVGSLRLVAFTFRSLESRLVAEKRTRELGVFSVLGNGLSLIAVVAAVSLHAPPTTILVAHMSSLFIYYFLVTAAAVQGLPLGAGPQPTVSQLWSEAWPFGLGGALASFTERSGVAIVFLVAGARAAGLFSSAYRFLEILTAVAGVAMTVVFPYLAEAGRDTVVFARRTSMLLRAAVAASGGVALWIAGLSPELLRTTFGAHYGDAAPVLVAMAPAIANVLPGNLVAYGSISFGRRNRFLLAAAAAAIIAVIVGSGLVALIGAVGAALALALAGTLAITWIAADLPGEHGRSLLATYLLLYGAWWVIFLAVVLGSAALSPWARVIVTGVAGPAYAWLICYKGMK
jgi:O-antigen/teichoic acid export membrane protein